MKKFNYFLLLCVSIFLLCGVDFVSAQNTESEKDLTKDELFHILIDSSNIYYMKGDYRKDLRLNLKLLNLAIELCNPIYIHKGYRNLGYDYLVLGDTILAKESFVKSEKQALLANDDTAMALTYMDLANVFSVEEGNTEEAFEYHYKSIDLFEKIKDSTGLLKAHYNTVLTALDAENYKTVYIHLIKAKKYAKHGDAIISVGLDILMGQYYTAKENYKMADSYFLGAIKSAEEESFSIQLEDGYYYYSESLFEQDKYKEAFEARITYEEYLYENQQKVISSESESLSANYQVSEYKKDVIAAAVENELQAQIVESQSKINKILIFVASGFIGLFIILYLAYGNRKVLVNQLKLKNKEYLEAKELSEKLSKAKSKFFSTVSHELRTPLYGVIGLSTILLEDSSLKSHEEDLKSLKFSADYLLALINDVLQMNKIDSNNIECEQTTFNIRDLIKKTAASFEYMHIQNNNNIHIQISDTVPQFVRGYSVQLSQILMNLIGNACKFTENGDIYVIAETTKYDEDKGEISFHIKDTGMGIPHEKQECIFEEFSQLESNGYKYQGTGLGLPIVKKLLKMIDSDIILTSNPGEGSLFSFVLKFDFINEIEEYRTPSILEIESLSGKRILIVEDNRINQTVTKKILENNEAVSVIVENGQEAVDIMKKDNFDLVLMDIHMPVMNGITATIEIRKFNTDTPIIALTAVEIEEVRHEIYESGMNDIIVKPYDVTKFLQTILKNINTKVPLAISNSKKAV